MKNLLLLIMIVLIFASCTNNEISTIEKKTPEPKRIELIDPDMANKISEQEYILKISPMFDKMSIIYKDITKNANDLNIPELNKNISELNLIAEQFNSIQAPESLSKFVDKINDCNKCWKNVAIELEELGNGKKDINNLLDNLYHAQNNLLEAQKIINCGGE